MIKHFIPKERMRGGGRRRGLAFHCEGRHSKRSKGPAMAAHEGARGGGRRRRLRVKGVEGIGRKNSLNKGKV